MPDCPICGADVTNPRRTYCSPACAAEARRRRSRSAANAGKPRKGIYNTKSCIDCGVIFFGHIKSKRCLACSAQARQKQIAECRTRIKHGKTRRIGSYDLCESCGQPYMVSSGNQKYCKECASAAVAANIRESHAEAARARLSDPAYKDARNISKRLAPAERICYVCGKSFFTNTTGYARFCSDKCRKQYRDEYQKNYNKNRRSKK